MTWKNRWLPILLIACGVLTATGGCKEKPASGPPPPDGKALAVIDGKPITLEAFTKELARRPGEKGPELKRELLDSMVRGELLFAAAKTAGYEKDPEVITAVKQVMTRKYLRDHLEPKLAKEPEVSDQEAEAYYQAHRDQFGTTAMVHAALIRIAVPAKASEETLAERLSRAEDARTEALALAPDAPAFGSVAVEYSEDQESRYRGGDIGWLRLGDTDDRWDKKVSEAIFALHDPGQVSPVITTADGHYLVKLIESKDAMVKPFAEVKDGVIYHVVQEKKRQIEEQFMEQLQKQIPVTVNSGLLQEIAQPGDETTAGPPALPAR